MFPISKPFKHVVIYIWTMMPTYRFSSIPPRPPNNTVRTCVAGGFPEGPGDGKRLLVGLAAALMTQVACAHIHEKEKEIITKTHYTSTYLLAHRTMIGSRL